MSKLIRLAVLGSLVLAACGGTTMESGDDGAMPDASGPISPTCQEATQHSDLTWIQDNVFSKSCAFGGCHNAPANDAGHLVLQAGESEANLVGIAAQTASPWMRVVAGQPDQSYLMVAIGGVSGPAPQGGLMPLAQEALCQEERDAIGRWITAGATP